MSETTVLIDGDNINLTSDNLSAVKDMNSVDSSKKSEKITFHQFFI